MTLIRTEDLKALRKERDEAKALAREAAGFIEPLLTCGRYPDHVEGCRCEDAEAWVEAHPELLEG